ncbi:MAG TPA: zinc-binding dehydrogenase, partial [Acidimicrobiales bacterium]|nr:zinc-binding dehydrogenase [Acidimicrobiales bacterium]
FDGVGGSVTTQSLRCLARNGRHLVVGFAAGIEAEEVPMVAGRALCFGNISLMGVLLAYRDSPMPVGSGFNPTPRSVGDAVHEHLVTLLRAGRIQPLVGKTVPFEQLPLALEDMEERQTIGRVVVHIQAPT